jgi:hypothetical protein
MPTWRANQRIWVPAAKIEEFGGALAPRHFGQKWERNLHEIFAQEPISIQVLLVVRQSTEDKMRCASRMRRFRPLTLSALASSNVGPNGEEAPMNWHQIVQGWQQLKIEIGFWWGGHNEDAGASEALIVGPRSMDVENDDARTATRRPDNHDHRCDFSQHIGC